jgi:hypothetical protein
VLCLDRLIQQIKSDPNIKGLRVFGNSAIKVRAYADDFTLIINDRTDLDAFLKVWSAFSSSSGSTINKKKSWIKQFYFDDTISKQELNEYQWLENSIEILEITYGSSPDEIKVLKKVGDSLEPFKNSSLSYKNKALLINTMAIPTIMGQAVATGWRDSTLKKIERKLFQFFWNGGTELVTRKTVMNPTHRGGWGVKNIINEAQSKLDSVVKKALTGEEDTILKKLIIYFSGISASDPASTSSGPTSMTADPRIKKSKEVLNEVLPQEANTPRIEKEYCLSDWDEAWNSITAQTIPKYVRDTNWKIVHRSVGLLREAPITMAPPNCPLCYEKRISFQHLFLECRFIREIWKKLANILEIQNIEISNFVLEGGWSNTRGHPSIHLILALTKTEIQKLRIIAKYRGQKKVTPIATWWKILRSFKRHIIYQVKFKGMKKTIKDFQIPNQLIKIQNNSFVFNSG